jgi:hypothetical protein
MSKYATTSGLAGALVSTTSVSGALVVETNQKSEYPVKRSGVVTDLWDAGPMCSRQG